MYSPLYDFTSPYQTLYHIPTQRRRMPEPVYYAPSYYDQTEPDEYYIPQRRVLYPEQYIQRVSYPQYYRSRSPDEYEYRTVSSGRQQPFEPEFSGPHSFPRYEDYRSRQPSPHYTSSVRNPHNYEPSISSVQADSPFNTLHPVLPKPQTAYRQRPEQGQRIYDPFVDYRNRNQLYQHQYNTRESNARQQQVPEFHQFNHPHEDNIALKRQRQQQLMAEKHKAQLEEQKRNHAIQLFRLKRAAKVIQRQWRLYVQQRRERAAKKIAEFVISQIEIRQARKILIGLQQLRDYEKEIDQIKEQQGSKVLSHPLKFTSSSGDSIKVPAVKENQNYLGYEDALLKMLIRIDSVDSLGTDIIRDARRALVKKTQLFLDQLDDYKNEQYKEYIRSQANSST
ncbi:hypothetical protein K7432_003921 [Basidiobolus ranarum]|uniref:BAG domain-containing protein n=1 Tax=Basidiobolus ranarum TaxID=34480 RepID=A0ABR2WZ18_9FUNG